MEQPEMVLPAERARGPSVCCTGRPLAHAAWKPFGDMARIASRATERIDWRNLCSSERGGYVHSGGER